LANFDRSAFVLKRVRDLAAVPNAPPIRETFGQLIDHDQICVAHQGGANRKHLPLAA
jgi:hypothetical protein